MTPNSALYRLTDHVCRNCLGRILRHLTLDGRTVVQCSNCGVEAVGESPVICACGIRRGPFARLRCARLERPIPGVAAEIVVTEDD
jgi:hypothetical protein